MGCAILEVDGQLERIVAVVAIQLERPDDGRILAQVGKWEDGKGAKPSCMLPGLKRGRGELPHKTVQQLLDADLSPWMKGVRMGDSEDDTWVMESASFGIRTKYLRTVHSATLHAK